MSYLEAECPPMPQSTFLANRIPKASIYRTSNLPGIEMMMLAFSSLEVIVMKC